MSTQLLHQILYTFYIFGQSAHNPYANITAIWLLYIPSIIALCILFGTSAFMFIYQLYFAINYGQTDSIVAMLFLISDVISNATVIAQSFIYHDGIRDVYRKFLKLLKFENEPKFGIKLNYDACCCDYVRTAILLLFLFIVMVVAKFCIRTNENDFILGQGYCALRFWTVLGKLHAIFYVRLLKNVVFCFVSDVQMIARRYATDGHISRVELHTIVIKRMNMYKSFHFDLYDISTQINQIFGWGLITLFVECFVDASYSLYWIFIYFRMDDGFVTTIFSNSGIHTIDECLSRIAHIFCCPFFPFFSLSSSSHRRTNLQFSECRCVNHHIDQCMPLLHCSGKHVHDIKI